MSREAPAFRPGRFTVYGLTPGPGAFPGVTSVFMYGQQVCNQFKHIFLGDLGKIEKDSTVIAGAWSSDYAIPLRRHQGKKYILWCSPGLQTELDYGEVGYLGLIYELVKKGVLTDIIHLDKDALPGFPGLHFPAPFLQKEGPPEVASPNREGAALYAPFHPRKNPLTQAVGAKLAGLRVHLNAPGGDQEVQRYLSLFKSIGVEFTNAGWFPSKKDMLAALAHRKVSLQCFLSESFCYTAIESMALGVPVVASGVVADNMGLSKQEAVVSPDNPVEIADRIRAILADYDRECRRAREAAKATAERNNEGFRKFISTVANA